MAKVTLDNNRQVEVEDAVAAQVEDCIDRLNAQVKTSDAKSEAAQAKLDDADEELKKEKAKSTDEAISKQVTEIVKTTVDAKKLAGKDFTCDSTNPTEIKLAALKAKNPTKDYTGKADAYIDAAFEIEAEKETDDMEEEEGKKKKAADSIANLGKDAAGNVVNDGKQKLTPRQKHEQSVQDAWKPKEAS